MNIQQPETLSRECLESVRSATAGLQAEREQFDVFIDKMLDEMETVRVDLTERERQLGAERNNVESHIREVEGLKEKIEEREQAASADESRTKQELEETQAKLWGQENRYKELAEAAGTAEANLQELSDHVQSLEEERDGLREKLDTVTHELSQIAGVLEMFESTQSELVETQSQLVQARDELDQVKLRNGSKADDRVRKLEGEKRSIENDLEQARTDVERLTKKVEDQKQQLSDHRSRWTEEIRQLRQTFESRTHNETSDNAESDSAVIRDVKHENVKVEVKKSSTVRKESESSDPVLGSILAQFEQLESLSNGSDN
jgi:chromosome segregation ATPase